MTHRRTLAGAALLALVTLYCGVPTDSEPRAIPDDRVPFGLLDPAPAPATPAAVTVFLVAENRLIPVPRDVPAPATPEKAVQALAAGASRQEAARGVRTAIPAASGVPAVVVDGGQARVDLPAAFLPAGTEDQILAVAQLVYTVTAFPGFESVAFSAPVPADEGTVRDRAVRRSDFSSVAHL